MTKKFTPGICKNCGHKDESTKTYVGTSVTMRCADCEGDSPYVKGGATLCRLCCPTGHGNRSVHVTALTARPESRVSD
jgi:hypothetical protein